MAGVWGAESLSLLFQQQGVHAQAQARAQAQIWRLVYLICRFQVETLEQEEEEEERGGRERKREID